eukprot:TRINITY_DN3066_c0_g1_i2.p1 TRINITY_DN3066_c0_g1~~TRINITY_DN3066_c0_g1_i2.p1  ORF type:complete len:234 (-),score=40.04 TRINITY_DN3066_c0_g1_i2:351-1052(-)
MKPHATKIVQGPIPANYTPYKLGEQILQYECQGNPGCHSNQGEIILVNQTYAHQLEEYLAASEFAKLKSGSPVPAVIARMGIYMHLLADRTSHYWCTNSDRSGLIPHPTEEGNFTSRLDQLACNFVTHAMEHFWEQGVDIPLANQSWAAVGLYFQELSAFKTEVETAAQWFNSSAVLVTQHQLLGTYQQPGPLATAMMKRNITERIGSLQRIVRQFGWAPVPGFETDCAGQPW